MQAGFLGKTAQRCGHWLAGLALVLSSAAAGAYSVTMSPAAQSVAQGTEVTVTITTGDVTGDGGLGAYDFAIGYDSNILSFAGIEYGTLLGTTSGDQFAFENSGVGSLLLLQTFDETNLATLLQLQGDFFANRSDPVTLFTLRFSTIGLGISQITFDGGSMSNVGATVLPTDIADIAHNSASVEVFANLAVPAPGTLPLVAAALMAAAVLPRRRSSGR